jgi:twitching motility two-component system response regulator PilG
MKQVSPLVIVIDDSPTVQKIIATTVQREGYQARTFSNGPDALRWLASAEAVPPAAVVIDICMPKMDGYEVIGHLKRMSCCAQTTFIMLSRRDGLVDRLKGRLAGAHVYLCKPFTVQQLLQTLQRYISKCQNDELLPV